jgi:D-3-phosphoglycerate dehydrogenase
MNQRILISTSSFSKNDPRPLKRLEQEGLNVQLNPYQRTLTKKEVLQLIPGVTGLIAGLEPLDGEVLNQSNLKVISRCGAGMSNVDLEEAKRLGIKVYNTPDAPTEAVAELTVAAMLNLLRSFPQMNETMRRGEWNKISGFQLHGKTVLMIGFGRIGRRVAQLLQPFGIFLLIVDPLLKQNQIPDGAKLMPLMNALPLADMITIHSSGDECILTQKEFMLIKTGAYLLNAARGNVIEKSSLLRALNEKKLSGVWMDAFWDEPYKGELANFSNVLLTPHIGSFTAECRSQMEMEAVENLIAGLKA